MNLPENFNIKIIDLGSSCWQKQKFTSLIQEIYYRSPEVILGKDYTESADMWSFACTIFEILTNDCLFEPKKNHKYSKSDDLLALMIELLKKFPYRMCTTGKYWRVAWLSPLRNISTKQANSERLARRNLSFGP